MATNLEKPMRFKEVQEHLGSGTDFLYKALENGDLKGYKLGRSWVVYPSDLKKFIEARCNQKKIRIAK